MVYATFGAFLIISAAYVIGKCVKDVWPWKTSALLSLTGSLLFLASAICLLQNWSETKSRNSWQPNTQRFVKNVT